MSTASVPDLLDAFDRLSGPDQVEFLSEILRRTKEMEWPPLDDETIDQIADESFLEYDAREAEQAERVGPALPGSNEMNDHE